MIVEKGSFKAAAKALHRTQPTLSVAIKKLENEFDLILFNRASYRPTLTEEGELFYAWARQCLRGFRSLEVVAKELGQRKTEARLTVIIDPVVRFESLGSIFETCLRPLTPTELVLRSEILCVGSDLLRKGEADFAVAPLRQGSDEIESLPLEKIEMIPLIAARLLPPQGSCDLAWLRQLPQIIVSSSQAGEEEAVGILEGGKRCLVSDHAMKRRLIEAGFGWGRLARHEWSADHPLTQLDGALVSPFTLDLHVMRSKLRPMGPIARSVWTLMQQVAARSI